MDGCQLAFNQGCFALAFCPAFLDRWLVGSGNGYGSIPWRNLTVCLRNRLAMTPLITHSFTCLTCDCRSWIIKQSWCRFPRQWKIRPCLPFPVLKEGHVMLNGLSNKRWLAFFRVIVLAHPHMSPDICKFRLTNPKRALNFLLHSFLSIGWPPFLNVLQ